MQAANQAKNRAKAKKEQLKREETKAKQAAAKAKREEAKEARKATKQAGGLRREAQAEDEEEGSDAEGRHAGSLTQLGKKRRLTVSVEPSDHCVLQNLKNFSNAYQIPVLHELSDLVNTMGSDVPCIFRSRAPLKQYVVRAPGILLIYVGGCSFIFKVVGTLFVLRASLQARSSRLFVCSTCCAL